MRLTQTSNRALLFAAVPLLAAITASVVCGQEPAPTTAAVPSSGVKIAGRVETLDDKVVGMVVTGDFMPQAGDVFDVLLTSPNGERSRVGRGKISFAKNGVVLGRLDEATGEIATGLEVSIQSLNPPRSAATPPASAPILNPPAVESPASVPAPELPAIDPAKQSGVFVSNEAGFPFVLQVETRGDFTLVRGIGRLPYSADDPTLIGVAFQGIGPASGRTGVRGALTLQSDGVRQKAPQTLPWVGLYDVETDGWQTMLSPNHFAGTARSGSPAVQAPEHLKKDDCLADDLLDDFVKDAKGALQAWQLVDLARDAAAGIQSHTPPRVRAQATSVRDNLRSRYTDLVQDMADFGSRISQGITGSGANPPPVKPSDPFTGKPLDQVLGTMWARGMTNDRLSSVLVAAPDAARAWQVTRVTRLPDGRIEIVNYGNAPDIAQGSTGASGGGNSGGQSGGGTGTGGSAGGGTQSGGSSGAGGGSSTSAGNTASNGGNSSSGATGSGATAGSGRQPGGVGGASGGSAASGGAANPGNPGQPAGGNVAGGGSNSGVTSVAGTPPSSAGAGRNPDSTSTDGSDRVSVNRSNPPASGPGDPGRPPLSMTQALDGLLDFFRGPNSPLNPPPPNGPNAPANPPTVTSPPPSGPGTPANPPTVTNPPPSVPGGTKPPSTPPPPPPVASAPGPRSGPALPPPRSRDPQVYDPNITVLVNEDGGQALTPALTAAQINAARAALNRNMVAGGVNTLAKGPKADGDPHADATGAKPDDKKPHPLAGSWQMTAPGANLPAGYTADVVITVNGGAIHIASTYFVPGSGNYSSTSDGTITGPEKGPYALSATTNGIASTATLTVSADSSTMTITVLGNTSTLRRTSPAPQPAKPGTGDQHRDAPAAAPASSSGAAQHTPPPATSPLNAGGPLLSQAQLDAARNALGRAVGGAAHSPPGSLNNSPRAPLAAPAQAALNGPTPQPTKPSVIRVPNVIGLTADEASSRIKAAGLNARSERGELASRPDESETVYAQEPKGGQDVQPSSVVFISIYQPYQQPTRVVGGKPARYTSLTGDWKCSCGETWSLQQQGQNIVGQESMDGRVRRLQGTFTGGQFRFAFQTTDGERGQGVMVPDPELKRMNWRMTLSTGESWDGSVQRQ